MATDSEASVSDSDDPAPLKDCGSTMLLQGSSGHLLASVASHTLVMQIEISVHNYMEYTYVTGHAH